MFFDKNFKKLLPGGAKLQPLPYPDFYKLLILKLYLVKSATETKILFFMVVIVLCLLFYIIKQKKHNNCFSKENHAKQSFLLPKS